MLPLGLAVVRRYAAERAQLERSGRKKSDFDLMIAGTAIEHEATLVTHDAALKDGSIGGLVVEGLGRFGSLMFVRSPKRRAALGSPGDMDTERCDGRSRARDLADRHG